jgi:hypothetical protein
LVLNKLFVEPLSDVINGVPHKFVHWFQKLNQFFFLLNRKIRLDTDENSNRIAKQKFSLSNQFSLLSNLNEELNLLPANLFLIERLPVSHTTKTLEFDDEYLSKNGLVLRCKLLEPSTPLILPLRLRISTRYPEDQPEILSLTKTMPPKLEFTGKILKIISIGISLHYFNVSEAWLWMIDIWNLRNDFVFLFKQIKSSKPMKRKKLFLFDIFRWSSIFWTTFDNICFSSI